MPSTQTKAITQGSRQDALPWLLHLPSTWISTYVSSPTVLNLIYPEGQFFKKITLFYPIVTSPVIYSSWLLVCFWSQVWKRKRKWYLWQSSTPGWAPPSTKPFPGLPISQQTLNFLNFQRTFCDWNYYFGTGVVFDCVFGCVGKFTEKLKSSLAIPVYPP